MKLLRSGDNRQRMDHNCEPLNSLKGGLIKKVRELATNFLAYYTDDDENYTLP
jgi:hypothetical protein